MLIVPKTHGAHLARSAPPDLVAVGHALRTALDRLRHCVDDPPPPHNVVFHTAPHHDAGARFPGTCTCCRV